MKLNIDKIPLKDISYENFVENYLVPEKPLIITDVNTYDSDDISVEQMIKTFKDEAKKSIGWYEDSVSSSDTRIPAFVREVLARDDMSLRPLAMRLFMQPKGHKTLFHYDGNSLHGFNLQMKGKKHWYLLSPHTPIASPPMMFISLVPKSFTPDAKVHDYYDFHTKKGEMLFLPRYWIHAVSTEGDENINYNWVFTPTYPNLSSPTGRRESELLLLRKKIPLVNKLVSGEYGEYGGQGEIIIEKYIKDISYFNVCIRVLKELYHIPKTLYLYKEIKAMADDFKNNNFKV